MNDGLNKIKGGYSGTENIHKILYLTGRMLNLSRHLPHLPGCLSHPPTGEPPVLYCQVTSWSESQSSRGGRGQKSGGGGYLKTASDNEGALGWTLEPCSLSSHTHTHHNFLYTHLSTATINTHTVVSGIMGTKGNALSQIIKKDLSGCCICLQI